MTKEDLNEMVYFVYKLIIIPLNKYYVGITMNPKKRFHPVLYKDKSLYPYILEYGWDNIKSVIVANGLTRKEAELMEDNLIQEGWKNDVCVNKQGSGGLWRDDNNEYQRIYYRKNKDKRLAWDKRYYETHKEQIRNRKRIYHAEHREERLEYNKRYYIEHQDELKEKVKEYRITHKEETRERGKRYYEKNKDRISERDKQYHAEHREERLEYLKKWRSTPEGKIYNRVCSFNQTHPDKMIETPKEARDKYLETGYIPSYVKNDDLN